MDNVSTESALKPRRVYLTHSLDVNGVSITLDSDGVIRISGYEFPRGRRTALKVLGALMRAQGRIVTHEELSTLLHGHLPMRPHKYAIFTQVNDLRKMLSEACPGVTSTITVIDDIGYRISPRLYTYPRIETRQPDALVENVELRFLTTRVISLNDQELVLNEPHYRLLRLLHELKDGGACDWEEFASAMYGPSSSTWPSRNVFHRYIYEMRKRFYEACGHELILTTPSGAYQLNRGVEPGTRREPRVRNTQSASMFSLKDLPDPSKNIRWVSRIKAGVSLLILNNEISVREVLDRYPDLSDEELRGWIEAYQAKGQNGLKALACRRKRI